jgi:hypothetical protein
MNHLAVDTAAEVVNPRNSPAGHAGHCRRNPSALHKAPPVFTRFSPLTQTLMGECVGGIGVFRDKCQSETERQETQNEAL